MHPASAGLWTLVGRSRSFVFCDHFAVITISRQHACQASSSSSSGRQNASLFFTRQERFTRAIKDTLYTTVSTTTPGRVGGLPVVYHPSYSAPKLAKGHRFPMQIFDHILHRLLHHHNLIDENQVRLFYN